MSIKFSGLCRALLGGCLLAGNAWALPVDNLHWRALGSTEAPWGLGVFYHLSPADGGLGVRGDLGLQVSHAFGASKNAAALVHVQDDSILLAFSHMTKPILASPARWTLGVDLRAPFTYLAEGQVFFPLGKFEPYVTFRMQSTGFAAEGGDGVLYETGASARFWVALAGLGASYALHPDLRLAASYTYRTAFGETSFRDAGVFHLSMQWLWGEHQAP